MKLKTLLLALLLVSVSSCNHKKKSEEIASYSYSSEVKLCETLEKRVGTWIEEGLECYGIIVMYDEKGNLTKAQSIKARTLVITEKAIKMKALESVSLAPTEGCTQMGLEKGDTWWENEGDLFKTKEEADAYIEKLKKSKIPQKDNHFTVD